jgi:thioredoxin reductase
MTYDIVIVGGGPAGLSAALALGRGRKHVLLCDSGPRRNSAATRIHNFVTRDGTPPDEFRRVAREQLRAYPNVEVYDTPVESITGERGAFRATIGKKVTPARRILLCTGMIDRGFPIEGFSELWGHAIFQCPYCHGWEIKDRPWGCLASAENAPHLVMFATLLRGWTNELVVFKAGAFELSEDTKSQLNAMGVRVEESPAKKLLAEGHHLEAIELESGVLVPCEALFAHPPQEQVALVRSLGLGLDGDGLVQVDPMRRETSIPGIYASGDLTTRAQGAILAAADGMRAAGMINLDLTADSIASGAPPVATQPG